jgi:hypothetical protein
MAADLTHFVQPMPLFVQRTANSITPVHATLPLHRSNPYDSPTCKKTGGTRP